MEAEIKITFDEILDRLVHGDSSAIVAEIEDMAITRFCEVLLHAPSSPVSANKAVEVMEWYEKAKEAGLFDCE